MSVKILAGKKVSQLKAEVWFLWFLWFDKLRLLLSSIKIAGTIPEIQCQQLSKDVFYAASAFLFIYDVTSIESYNNVFNW